ncbi:MAG: WhiB family transcriptional regulator [Actinomycetota bacterium]|nr:WhiB family transcriptional regulator [Actinomycetota bacterium]
MDALGLCRDRPDVTWFPEKGQSAAPAKAVCAGCPTRAPCLEYALGTAALTASGAVQAGGGAGRRSERRPSVLRSPSAPALTP